MKLSEIKAHYQIVLKNLIERSDDEVFTATELKQIFEKKGYKQGYCSIRRTLYKIADKLEYNHTVYYGNKKAIAKLKKIFNGGKK